MPSSGFLSPTKHELTNKVKISRSPNLFIRYKFSSVDSLLIVDIKYLPDPLSCRANSRTSACGRESENMYCLKASWVNALDR